MSKTETKTVKKNVLVYAIIFSFVAGAVTPTGLSMLTPVQTEKEGIAYIQLSSWASHFSLPYDQGFEAVEVYVNNTGSWVLLDTLFYDDDGLLEVDAGQSVKLIVFTWLNSTLVGAGSGAEGKLYQQHNVSVTDFLGSSVFSQQNFTYESVDTGIDPPLWMYEYSVILNFETIQTEYYTVVVTYETYY